MVQATKSLDLGNNSRARAVKTEGVRCAPFNPREQADSPVELDILNVDSDGAVGDASDAALGVNSTGSSLVSHDAHAGGEEVAGVGVGLEADEVAAEHAIKDSLATCRNEVEVSAQPIHSIQN